MIPLLGDKKERTLSASSLISVGSIICRDGLGIIEKIFDQPFQFMDLFLDLLGHLPTAILLWETFCQDLNGSLNPREGISNFMGDTRG